MPDRIERGDSDSVTQAGPAIFVTATFTAEPIEPALKFWLNELGFGGRIRFAAYNQVFQQLLDSNSELGQNQDGVNIVLIRLEDWTRFRAEGPDETVFHCNVKDLAASLRSFAQRSSTPTLIWVAPPSALSQENGQSGLISDQIGCLRSAVEGFDSLHWLEHAALAPYPVPSIEDPQRDRLGHIPFTPLYYTALATAIARRIHAIWTAPYKVLALDCDNTLWQGVVGEDGPLGVALTPGKRALQEFAVLQQQQGMLLCLVSSNAESDVFEVFEKRSEMPLRRKHLVACRIGWQTKSQSLRELAGELNLGLDAFIFLDDNPVECGKARAELPEVVTLQVPSDDADIAEYLRHIWAFDHLRTTAEDRQRTLMYLQNVERDRLERQAASLDEFLAGLQLKTDIAPPMGQEWSRVAQLTQRTNQFNFTTIRRTEAEVRLLSQEGLECLRIRVSDRFGDYGLVGLMIFAASGDGLRIDTMLLSCRVLGRGVEHAMLARLGRLAAERGLSWVEAPVVPTAKNEPAVRFLHDVGSSYRRESERGVIFRFPAEAAAKIVCVAFRDAREPMQAAGSGNANKCQGQPRSALYTRIATDLRQIEAVERAAETAALAVRPEVETPLVEPQTPLQRELTALWMRLLHLDRVGIRDDFQSLGGTSLVAAQLFAEIEQRFGARLAMTTIIEAPTIELLALRLEGGTRASLKVLRPGRKGGPALFFVHDGDGETLLYGNLARRLPEEVAVYGIEPRGTARCPILHTRIPDMASYYIDQVRHVRPQGPYYLGGMCAGGVIAFEMALQMRARGLAVGFVAMLDSAAPRAHRRAWLIAARRGARFFQALHHDDQGETVIRRLARKVLRATGKAGNLAVYEAAAGLRRLSHGLRFRTFRWTTDRGWSAPWFLQGLTVRTVYQLAEREYAPAARLDAPTILFRATEGEGADEAFVNLFVEPLLGWGKHLVQEMQVIDVVGGHSSMLQEPKVSSLAEHLSACLESAITGKDLERKGHSDASHPSVCMDSNPPLESRT